MKILHLTIKKKWFDQIINGVKFEEYREIKPYWVKRLVMGLCAEDGGIYTVFGDLSKKDYHRMISIDFTHIQFRNGYRPDSPTILVECKGIDIGEAVPEWSDNWKGNVFRIKLGIIIEKK